MPKPTGKPGVRLCSSPSATGLQFTTPLTWRLLPGGKSRWPRWTGNCAQPPRAREFSCWVREDRVAHFSQRTREVGHPESRLEGALLRRDGYRCYIAGDVAD